MDVILAREIVRCQRRLERTNRLGVSDEWHLVRAKPTAYGRATLIGSADPA